MKSCPKFKKIIIGNDHENGKGVVVRARCKQWKCEYCATINAMVWVYRIKDTVAPSGNVWSFVTFTAPRKNRTPEATLRALQIGWKKFCEALRHKRGKQRFRYLRVYELHKDGTYHLHAILEHKWDDIKIANEGTKKEYTYSRWIKDNAPKWGFGYMGNAGNFTGSFAHWNTARYIAKYLTKGDDRIEDGVRRFQPSHGFAKASKSENSIDWIVSDDYTVRDLFHHLNEFGEVVDLTTGSQITYDEVNEHQTYVEFIYRQIEI